MNPIATRKDLYKPRTLRLQANHGISSKTSPEQVKNRLCPVVAVPRHRASRCLHRATFSLPDALAWSHAAIRTGSADKTRKYVKEQINWPLTLARENRKIIQQPIYLETNSKILGCPLAGQTKVRSRFVAMFQLCSNKCPKSGFSFLSSLFFVCVFV